MSGSILGTIAGGVGGFMLGGPAGAMAGAGLGAQIGGGSDANQTNRDLAKQAQEANQASADKAMSFEAQEAEKNRQYQTYMASTERQRAVADLKASGLNPLLAGDTGAATPSGSSAKGVSAQNTPAQVDNVMSGSLSGALDIYNAANQAKKLSAEVGLTEATMHRQAGGVDLDRANKEAIEAQRARDRMIQPAYDFAGKVMRRFKTGADNSLKGKDARGHSYDSRNYDYSPNKGRGTHNIFIP